MKFPLYLTLSLKVRKDPKASKRGKSEALDRKSDCSRKTKEVRQDVGSGGSVDLAKNKTKSKSCERQKGGQVSCLMRLFLTN